MESLSHDHNQKSKLLLKTNLVLHSTRGSRRTFSSLSWRETLSKFSKHHGDSNLSTERMQHVFIMNSLEYSCTIAIFCERPFFNLVGITGLKLAQVCLAVLEACMTILRDVIQTEHTIAACGSDDLGVG